MSELKVRGLRRAFGAVQALDGIDLDVADGEFFCILGPSASGKTTTLRSIAGLEELQAGEILFGGNDVTDAPVQGRGMAMIFQTFALYPHLTIEANLGYPLQREGLAKSEIRRRVGEVAELLRVSHTLDRKPATLSGGEQQRVAIGRAIVRRPKLLLLDEPLTNLDAKLRNDMRAEFKRLHRELGMTMLYATPDQLEALTLGDRIGVIRDGKVITVGDPRELYVAPQDTYVARMVGSPPINFVDVTVGSDGRANLPFSDASIKAPGFSSGDLATFGIRPHDVRLAPETGPDAIRFPARIHLTEPLGDVTIIDVKVRDTDLKLVLREETAARYSVGDDIEIGFDPSDSHLFSAETGARRT